MIVMQIYFLYSFLLLHTPISLLCIARQLWRERREGKGGESERSVGLAAEITPGGNTAFVGRARSECSEICHPQNSSGS